MGDPAFGVSAPLVTDCDNRLADPCEDRYVTVAVPAGGAVLTVTITPDNPLDDYDLAVYDPSGHEIGTSGGSPVVGATPDPIGVDPTSTETVTVAVTTPGLYRFRIDPYNTVVGGTYRGSASLG